MGECISRTIVGIGLIPKVHGCDEAALHRECVENIAIPQYSLFEALDELVHPDADLAAIFLGHRKRFGM